MKKITLYTIIFTSYFLTNNVKSQTIQIDSLKTILKHINEDTTKVNVLNNLSIEFISNNLNDSAFRYSLEAKEIAQKLNFTKGLALSYNILANIYFYQGNYNEALKNNLASLKIKKALADIKGIANSYNNIGNTYLKLGNTEESLKNHFLALNIRKDLSDKKNLGFSYNNIGNVYQKQGNYQESLKYHFESLKIKKENNDNEEIVTSLNNIGSVYTELGKFSESLQYHFEALKIEQELNDKEAIEITYANLCNTYYKLKNYKTAKDFGIKALRIASEIGDTETIVEINLLLSNIYRNTKEFEKSLFHFSEYVNLKDSLFNEENIKKTVQIHLQNEFEKAVEAAKLEQVKKETTANIEHRKQKQFLVLICCVLILVLLISIFIYRNYKINQKASRIINSQKIEAEKQKTVIEDKNKDITASITYAQRIQNAILPSNEKIKEILPDTFVLYKPKDILAGDFYWVSDAVTKYEEKFVMAAVADCTGHGVPGALMSIIGNNYLRLCEREPSVNRPSEALDFINVGISKTLRQEYSKSAIQDGMDMVFIAIDYNTMLLHFAGAKNPIYIVREGILQEYKGDKHPIGAFVGEEMKKFTNHSIPIQKGDCVYLFTDGFADQFGGINGKKFMYNKFKHLIASNSHLSMDQQCLILSNEFDKWKGDAEQVDDVCVFGIRI
jgi:serine phosphatase RsbU (regulator of sigma subunit)